MGSIISAAGSTTAVIVSAAVLSFCGSMSASQVMYLDL
jgi:solute carrier family 45 protein 1/2/4